MMNVLSCRKFEKSIFFPYNFLNEDISLIIPQNILKFDINVNEGYLEGKVSQVFFLGPTLYSMKSRK